ncbi:regulatory protein [Streptomyces albus]|uniref:Regulatory protein n=1 Tax=Streptomyces albus (strain ATCC 21838 / DSM 41398 / FERM P-419 / JCM 4703 / NBRC 107858) TaxID=1081613 RepID=A0A0B5EWS1_STRA4|nr:regulatory protein [Streptomyces albus]AOU77438.1 regulatory protein [Streptomyces albus]AYN33211.1 regulatory protein [Streptomyces albus]
MKDGKVWVGDQVYDEVAERSAFVTDVRDGNSYVLRPRWGGGETWCAADPGRLTLVTARDDAEG